MHPTIYGKEIPHEREGQYTTDHDDSIVHILYVRVTCRRKEENDRGEDHPDDRDDCANSALRYYHSSILDDWWSENALTHAPSENGPGVHPFSFLQIHRAAIGIEYAMYCAIFEMEKTALTACVPAKTTAPSEIEPAAQNKTVLTGVLVKLFMR
jgi:hypothetical protein